MKQASWEGKLTKLYESRLGLHGGYVRRINPKLPTSLSNSEYVKSDDVSLYIVARKGVKISPIKSIDTRVPHYNNYYAHDKSSSSDAINGIQKNTKELFLKKIKRLKESE